jgi:hypothetical protein
MGLLANLPVGLAPGLGLNAYVRASSGIGIPRFYFASADDGSPLSSLTLLLDSTGLVLFHTVRHWRLSFWKGTLFEMSLASC